ncbi:hypothetical protein HNO92_002208 [Chromobacterium alkanivorans]|nr:hypothetical protein [Chromobacterium alkanivorans]MCS3819382.1 hypothetical protein [Chromobacterium alkanivorans]MCS3873894.1 hypothetical protein [Chromobacterium alkanivorans]
MGQDFTIHVERLMERVLLAFIISSDSLFR